VPERAATTDTLLASHKDAKPNEHRGSTHGQHAEKTNPFSQRKQGPPTKDPFFVIENGLTDTRTSQPLSNVTQTVPTGNLIDLEDGDEQATVFGPIGAFSSSSAPARQTNQVNDSLILPQIDSSSLNINLDLFTAPSTGNIWQEGPTISTFVSTDVHETQGSDSEIVQSPTRTLFPSRSYESRSDGSTIIPQGSISHATAASLRREIEKIKEDRDHWQNEYIDKVRELEEERRKCDELEMRLKSLVNMGLDL